ncbi:hypothetical protein ABZ016_13965 [Streptomyces sp. NPDC006372]|uniref:hypothetical protein n=1 Tax=Streptomyces sp. NPDC006372 TaxID=3155599 RepID=UPI0033AD362E
MNTRWDDDLSGRLLKEEPDDWIVIDLPAIALTDNAPLGRQPGEALWPERYNEDDYARIRKSVGERVWWALYQQQPRPLEGGVWQWVWITSNQISPAAFRGVNLTRGLVAIDPSGGASTANDETGIIAAGRDTDGELERQMVTWLPGMDSPDRMDAAVHALTELADPAQTGLGTQHYSDQRLRGRR